MTNTLSKWLMAMTGMMARIPDSLIALLARIIIAAVFWKSAMTKLAFNDSGLTNFSWDQFWNVMTLDWTVSQNAFMLFEYEFDLPVIPHVWATYLSVAAEIILPILLLLGFFTRYAALMLLLMTLVIQIFVFPHLWVEHGQWAIPLLFLMAKGGGRLSIDYIFCRKCL